jgi:protease-4
VTRVADGRHLDPVKAEAIARGRVWTGTQAKERGLVDVLGGLDEAVRQAKQAAGLSADAPAVLRAFPERNSTFERLFARIGGAPAETQSLATLQRLSVLAPLLHRLEQFSQMSQGGAVMQPIDIVD